MKISTALIKSSIEDYFINNKIKFGTYVDCFIINSCHREILCDKNALS
jgi:hypothetical protein